MLTIDEVVTTYGPVRALNGVSFEVPDATITAVLGANGAGKTTLLGLLTGALEPDSGSPELITTVPGLGYRFSARVESA